MEQCGFCIKVLKAQKENNRKEQINHCFSDCFCVFVNRDKESLPLQVFLKFFSL